MPDKESYKSVALRVDLYSKLKKVAEKENRPIGRELGGIIEKRHDEVFPNAR